MAGMAALEPQEAISPMAVRDREARSASKTVRFHSTQCRLQAALQEMVSTRCHDGEIASIIGDDQGARDFVRQRLCRAGSVRRSGAPRRECLALYAAYPTAPGNVS